MKNELMPRSQENETGATTLSNEMLSASASIFHFPNVELSYQPIGTGFDIITGQPIAGTAIKGGAPTSTDKDTVDLEGIDELVSDQKTANAAISASQKTSGSGFGVKASESTSGKIEAHFSSTSLSVYINQTTYTKFVQIKTASRVDTVLTQSARDLLDQPNKEKAQKDFEAAFGTHFIAGHVYGGTAALSYHMEAYTASAQAEFHTKLTEKAGMLGVSEKSQEAIDGTIDASTSHVECSVKYKFTGDAPDCNLVTVDDLRAASQQFRREIKESGGRVIQYIVMPWTALECVKQHLTQSKSLVLNDRLEDLTNEANSLEYVIQCARSFKPLGMSQKLNIGNIQDDAEAKRAAIMGRIKGSYEDGNEITAEDKAALIDPRHDSLILHSELQDAMDKFRIYWKIESGYGQAPISPTNYASQSGKSVYNNDTQISSLHWDWATEEVVTYNETVIHVLGQGDVSVKEKSYVSNAVGFANVVHTDGKQYGKLIIQFDPVTHSIKACYQNMLVSPVKASYGSKLSGTTANESRATSGDDCFTFTVWLR